MRQAGKTGEQFRARGRHRDRFQQQMIEAKGEIERRIAIPGAFGIKEDRACRTDENVFRADIAMDHGSLGRLGAFGKPAQRFGEIGMRARRGQKIRLQADCLKNRVGRKSLRRKRIARKARMDHRQPQSDLGREGLVDMRGQ